jgi:hypothetical protein
VWIVHAAIQFAEESKTANQYQYFVQQGSTFDNGKNRLYNTESVIGVIKGYQTTSAVIQVLFGTVPQMYIQFLIVRVLL